MHIDTYVYIHECACVYHLLVGQSEFSWKISIVLRMMERIYISLCLNWFAPTHHQNNCHSLLKYIRIITLFVGIGNLHNSLKQTTRYSWSMGVNGAREPSGHQTWLAGKSTIDRCVPLFPLQLKPSKPSFIGDFPARFVWLSESDRSSSLALWVSGWWYAYPSEKYEFVNWWHSQLEE